ncbi:MAG: hypothetical protein WB586_03410 [Chthoniobacterales bacterium]
MPLEELSISDCGDGELCAFAWFLSPLFPGEESDFGFGEAEDFGDGLGEGFDVGEGLGIGFSIGFGVGLAVGFGVGLGVGVTAGGGLGVGVAAGEGVGVPSGKSGLSSTGGWVGRGVESSVGEIGGGGVCSFIV